MAYSNWSNNGNGSDMGPWDQTQNNTEEQESNVPSFSSLLGGSTYMKFQNVGDSIIGTVKDWKGVRATQYGSNAPLLSRSGRPIFDWRITLTNTNQHDQNNPDDNGERVVQLHTYKLDNLRDEMLKHHMDTTKAPIGVQIRITYTGNKKPTHPGMRGAKLFKLEFLTEKQPAAQATPQQSQQQAPQQQEPAF